MNPLLAALRKLRENIITLNDHMTDMVVSVYALTRALAPLEAVLQKSAALNIRANRISEINTLTMSKFGDKITTLPVTLSMLEEGLSINNESVNRLGAKMAFTGQNFALLMSTLGMFEGTLALTNRETNILANTIDISTDTYRVTADKLVAGLSQLAGEIGGMLTIMGTQSKVLDNATDIQAKLGPQYIGSVNKLFQLAGSLEFEKWALLGDQSRIALQRLIEGGDYLDFRSAVISSSKQLRKFGAFTGDIVASRAVADMFGTELPGAIKSLEEAIYRYESGQNKLDEATTDYRNTLTAFKNQALEPLMQLGITLVPVVTLLTDSFILLKRVMSFLPENLAAGITAGVTAGLARGLVGGDLLKQGGFLKGLIGIGKFASILGGVGLIAGLLTSFFSPNEPKKTIVTNTSPIPVKPVEKTSTASILSPNAQIYGIKTTQAIQEVLNKIPMSDNLSQKVLQEMRMQNDLLRQVITTIKKTNSGSLLEGK